MSATEDINDETYGRALSMLDALPDRSVVLDSDGDAWQKSDGLWASVVRGTNTERMGSGSLAILTPIEVAYRPVEEPEAPHQSGLVFVPPPIQPPQRPPVSAQGYLLGTVWVSGDGSAWEVEWDDQDKRHMWVLVSSADAT